MSNGAPIDPTNQNTIPNTSSAPTQKKSSTGKIVLIIVIVLLLLLAIPIAIFAIAFGGILGVFSTLKGKMDQGNKLVCNTTNSSLTVYYNNSNISGTLNTGSFFDYDTDEIREHIHGYPTVENGLIDFGKSLVENSDGTVSCELNGQDVTKLSINNQSGVTQVVGNERIGYVDLSTDWDIIQSASSDSAYGSYINSSANVSMGINISYLANVSTSDDENLTVHLQSLETYAEEYMQAFGDKDGVRIDTETVTIGKDKNISAIKATKHEGSVLTQVSYFFEKDNNTHIVTFNIISGGDKASSYINPIMDTFRFEN